MRRFDRLMLGVIVGLGTLLLGVILWATSATRDSVSGRPGFLYLASTPAGETQIYQWNWETQTAQQVAQLPSLVITHAGVAQLESVVYPVEREDGGHDLWLVDVRRHRAQRWLACAPDDCLAVAPSPAGDGVVYTRVTNGEPALWWMAYGSSESYPLFEAGSPPGHHAAWSPDGSHLAYTEPGGPVHIVTLETEAESLRIPVAMEFPPAWSPNGKMLLVTDMRLETGFASHILRVDVASGEILDLSDRFGVEDDAPVWSPDGQWVAFLRRVAGTSMGKQVWVMRGDGSDARSLTEDITSHYGRPVWLDDGDTLLVTRYAEGSSEIWAVSASGGEATLVVPNGYAPHRLDE
jgi:TolB protein